MASRGLCLPTLREDDLGKVAHCLKMPTNRHGKTFRRRSAKMPDKMTRQAIFEAASGYAHRLGAATPSDVHIGRICVAPISGSSAFRLAAETRSSMQYQGPGATRNRSTRYMRLNRHRPFAQSSRCLAGGCGSANSLATGDFASAVWPEISARVRISARLAIPADAADPGTTPATGSSTPRRHRDRRVNQPRGRAGR